MQIISLLLHIMDKKTEALRHRDFFLANVLCANSKKVI
jgi:hypothetical protein